MFRRPSVLTRLGYSLIGLVTVWCLGCSSYEPLLASLFGETSVTMTCDSEMASQAKSSDQRATDSRAPAVRAPGDARGFDCGCGGSCYAPSPIAATVAVAAPVLPRVDVRVPTAPASIERVPLLPPPEFAA